MSQPLRPVPGNSTRQVLDGWDLGGAPDADDPLGDSRLASPSDAAGSDRRRVATGRGRGAGHTDAPFLDFRIDPDAPAADDSLFRPARATPTPTPTPAAGVRPHEALTGVRTPAAAGAAGFATPAAPTAPPPKPGEVIGGFRIVSELGRGAFARVYLAEQIELGDRPVALKVSKAEGEEPQMLARLQHAHIVPIHSVFDDPETGLRLLCMPYLGGANLAQVLEEAGARNPGGQDRRSLVNALDEVSQRIQQAGPAAGRGSVASGASRLASRKTPPEHLATGARSLFGAAGTSGPDDPGASAFGRSLGRESLTRLHDLWDRFTGRRGGEASGGFGLDGRDFDQPARQFLREANTTQAAVWIIARLAEGLEHAHSRGLLHRDLKPSNILIAGDGTPMLLDFNLSSSIKPADPAEGEKAMLGGTLPYMSPEHLDAFDPRGTTAPEAVDERSDLYSLGLILFEMIAGDHPFPEPPPRLPLLESIRFLTDQRRQPPSLRVTHPSVPWSLDAIVAKCLAPEPRRRYARARDLADDLNRYLEDLPLRHAPEPSPRERMAKWARRNPRLCGTTSIAGFAALLIFSLGGLIGLLYGNMQNLSTRLKLQVFRDEFTECRFLLNAGTGPVEHLGPGIDKAQRALDHQGIDRAGGWRPDSWVRRLTARERAEVGQQTTELILMEARARVYLAERVGTEADRNQALEWAVRWLDRAEQLDPAPPAALFSDRARFQQALGRADLAGRDRRRAAAAVPSSSRDFTLLGSTLLAGGDLPGAEAALLKAVDLDPRGFWGWFALGHCHFEQGRTLDAAGDFAACVVLEPKFAWPHMNRGLALARAGRLTEARTAYGRALEANPRFAEAWVNRALVDLELNDLADAERALARSWELGRRGSDVMVVWAEVKARLGHRDEAERLFAATLRGRPDDPTTLTARGVFRIATDPEAAGADLRHALRVNPRDPRAHYGLAMLLRRVSPTEALAEADAALDADPDLLDALEIRALLRARLGDLSAADDAERLIQVQTPRRLYNASCALALLVETAGESRLAPRALTLLNRALDGGFAATEASADPDLHALRALPGYRDVLSKPRPVAVAAWKAGPPRARP